MLSKKSVLTCRFVAQSPAQAFAADSAGQPFKRIIAIAERLQVQLDAWPTSVSVKVYEVAPPSKLLQYVTATPTRTLLADVPIVVPGGSDISSGAGGQSHGYAWISPANCAPPAFSSTLTARAAQELPSIGQQSDAEAGQGQAAAGEGKPAEEPQAVVPAGACCCES